ncbi:MAG: uroporphyrinogen decarboxylase family protein [Candidatus Pacebacteria bacterium]|nr:uroporphyrinogen decarboxylase family protein [Candidatus Paceibacterota bacterium]
MTSRERVLAALNRETVDRIPWIEGIVRNGIASAVCGEPIDVDWSVAPDGFPTQRGAELAAEQKKVNHVLGKDNVQFSAFAPIFATKMEPATDGSPVLIGDGQIKTREGFERLFKLPSPEDRSFVENAREFIANKEDYCACACVRLGIGATLLSMGLEAFSYAMVDDPQLIVDVHDAYADWTAAVVPVLEDIGFDVIWAFDDVAFNSGPVFSPAFYREHILPKERAVAATFSKPLITHSDGNMTPLLDDWLTLGQKAIHPIQPDVMDIGEVKRCYGDRFCLVGNIFMDDLVHKTPEAIDAQVNERIETVGRGGGYILSSSNSLTDDMKPENVLAIREAIGKYGTGES